jgi:hypothetical protein
MLLHLLNVATSVTHVLSNCLQADAAGARAVLTTYNTLLLAAGKSACEECAVCYEPLTGSSAVTLLGCGHIFHRWAQDPTSWCWADGRTRQRPVLQEHSVASPTR